MDPSTADKPAPIIFGDESLSDVTLVVEQQEFIVHKMFLAIRSDVFKAMFYGEFKESKENRIEIKEVSVNNFRRFLDILYTGKIRCKYFMEMESFNGSHCSLFTTSHEERIFWGGVPPKNTILRNVRAFWKNATEILKIADRFNITAIVKDHLESVIQFNIKSCEKMDCYQCLNYFFFSLIHGLDVSNCQKRYPKDVYKLWLKCVKEEQLFDAIPLEIVEHLILKLS